MITYREYYQRMKAIQDALNQTSVPSKDPINRTGLTGQEVCMTYIGKYITELVTAKNIHASDNLCLLIYVVRSMMNDEFDFCLLEPDEFESMQSELDEQFRNELISYSRMNRIEFIGAAASFINEYSVDEELADLPMWAIDQARHLANYCVSHNIDLLSDINRLSDTQS